MKVAVVGAGLAGISCARALIAAGHAVEMFEKGRGAGGRIATRRAGGASFNHGAQHATARDPGFSALLAELAACGVVARWDAATGDGPVRWVGAPTMTAFPRALAPDGVQLQRQVTFLHRGSDGWTLRHDDAAATRPGVVVDSGGALAGPFDAVVLALPGPQAAPLLAAAGHAFAEAAASVTYAPCWSAMATFAAPIGGPDTRRGDGALSWAAREGSRPGAPAGPEAWTLHGSGAWSRSVLEQPAETVAAALLAAFDPGQPATSLATHRWRYALVERALGQPCLWDAAAGLGACGDWCLEGRVEAAFRSGTALAAAITGGP